MEFALNACTNTQKQTKIVRRPQTHEHHVPCRPLYGRAPGAKILVSAQTSANNSQISRELGRSSSFFLHSVSPPRKLTTSFPYPYLPPCHLVLSWLQWHWKTIVLYDFINKGTVAMRAAHCATNAKRMLALTCDRNILTGISGNKFVLGKRSNFCQDNIQLLLSHLFQILGFVFEPLFTRISDIKMVLRRP